MNFDRRQQPRLTADSFAFIQVEGDEGGSVVNVSEDGLCFRAFSVVRQADQVRFWFSFNLRDRIEAVGRLAWWDDTRKLGGLALTSQSHSAREQIRSWVRGVCAEENKPGRDGSTTESASGDLVRVGAEPSPIHLPEYRVPSFVRSSDEAVGAENNSSLAQASGEFSNSRALVPLERYISATRLHFVRGVVLGVLASSAVAIPVFKYTNGQQKRSLQEMSQGASLEISSTPTTAELGGSNSDEASRPLTPSTTAKPETSIPLRHSLDGPFQPYVAVRRVHSKAPNSEGGALSTASPSTNETKRIRNSATPQQLWSSVQAGNSKAAVTLADLYIRGDGVPVNCDQARVLLLVASEKNNEEAIRRLRDLDKAGCPAP
jgi:hypothetical protein